MTPTQEIPWTSEALFPEPLQEKYFLWAHHWEDLESGLWSHPGIDEDDDPRFAEQGGLTTAQAMEEARRLTSFYLSMIDTHLPAKTILWNMAARYQWLCEFTEARDPVWWKDTEAWAKDRLPRL